MALQAWTGEAELGDAVAALLQRLPRARWVATTLGVAGSLLVQRAGDGAAGEGAGAGGAGDGAGGAAAAAGPSSNGTAAPGSFCSFWSGFGKAAPGRLLGLA